MKKFWTTCLTLTLINAMIFAQVPSIQWAKSIGGSGSDHESYITATADGGSIMAGHSNSFDGDIGSNQGEEDAYIVKLDANGNIQWQRTLGGSEDDSVYAIQSTPDGGCVFAGSTRSNDGDISGNHNTIGSWNDAWVVKLDATGAVEWQKLFGGTDRDFAYGVQNTEDGGYIVVGATKSNDGDVTGNHGDYDLWVLKLDDTGTIEWQRCYGGTDVEVGHAVRVIAGNGYIVAGLSFGISGDVTNNNGQTDFWVIKLDNDGEIQWERSLGGNSHEAAYDIQPSSDGGYGVVGYTYSSLGINGYHGMQDIWFVKLASNGNLQWQKAFGGSQIDHCQALEISKEGGFILLGSSNSANGDLQGNHGLNDFWVLNLDLNGEIQWGQILGGSGYDYGTSISTAPDGTYFLSGLSNSSNGDVDSNNGGYDFWVLKLASSVPTTSLQTNSPLLAVFPNPAIDQVTISLPIPYTISSYSLMDLKGREIIQVTMEASTGEATLLLQDIPKGMYLLSVRSGDQVLVRKLSVH